MRKRTFISVAVSSLTIFFVSSTTALAQIEAPAGDPQMVELARQFDTAEALYNHLKDEADGGQPLAWDNLPDWSGVYTRGAGGIRFDPVSGDDGPTTATLTSEYQEMYDQKLERISQNLEFDPLSRCDPPGHPRWLTEPFLKEFIVTPDQTWLINEMVNDIRRIYTDGRAHTPEADSYPLFNGDSIGFWDGGRLVTHTSQLRSGQYQRMEPEYTEQVETVEVWEKVDDATIEVDVLIYDPPALAEPWYTRQIYVELDNPDDFLRLRYWHCGENQNNEVIETDAGGSDFNDFDFTETDN
jgi:hypothetical protein